MAEENLDLGAERKARPVLLYCAIGSGIIAVVVAAMIIGKLGPFAEPEDVTANAGGDASNGTASASVPGKPLYYDLQPSFTINFGKASSIRLMQLSLSVLTRDQAVIDAMDLHMPMIQNNLLMLLSKVDTEQVQTNAGKELVREQLLAELQQIVRANSGLDGVEQVFFTKFLTQ